MSTPSGDIESFVGRTLEEMMNDEGGCQVNPENKKLGLSLIGCGWGLLGSRQVVSSERLLQKSNSGLYFYKFINFLKDFY